MIFRKKTYRYYYWIIAGFIKNNIKFIGISFFLSFIIIIGIVSVSPYIEVLFTTKREIIGIIGKYDYNSLPQEIKQKISNGLLYINEKGKLVPMIATSYELKKKGMVYRFHINNDLLWNDNTKFKASDINYQFKDVETKVLDDTTIEFVLKKPLPIFPSYLTKPIIKYPLTGVAGLYKLQRADEKYGYIKELVLEPNKKEFPMLTYKFYENETQLLTAYKKGEITNMTVTKKSIAQTFDNWKNTKVEKIVDYSRLLTIFFNMDNPYLKEKVIRKAINEGINREKFAEFGELAAGPIPPISWAYDENMEYPIFDLEGSKKILKQDKNSTQSAKLNAFTYYDYLDIAEEIENSFNELNMNIELNTISYDKPSNFDFLIAYWKVPSDPDQYYFWHSTQKQGNIGNYQNMKIDKILEDGRDTISIEMRKKIYDNYQKIIMDDPPGIFLYYPYIYIITRK